MFSGSIQLQFSHGSPPWVTAASFDQVNASTALQFSHGSPPWVTERYRLNIFRRPQASIQPRLTAVGDMYRARRAFG